MASQSAIQEEKLRRGSWLEEEDEQLIKYVTFMGERRWDSIARASGLRRSGRSCRLRWLNYLRPNIKRGHISAEEERIILQLQEKWGNKWSRIAQWLPGRTDNEIKNYWRTHLRKKASAVQPQGNLHCEMIKSVNLESLEKMTVPISNSHNVVGWSYAALTNSPNEIRLSDWVSELTTNQQEQEANHHEECKSLDFGFCFLNCDFSENEACLWDSSSGSLWDMF